MKRISTFFISFFIMIVIATSCTLNGTVNNTGGATNFQDGYVMAVQTSPDAEPLNIYVGNSPWDTAMKFGDSTFYADAPPGTYTFSVAPTSGSSSSPLSTTNLTVNANSYYTYFIIDSFANLQTTVTKDVFQRPANDSFYVRFLNFSPDSDPLSVVDSAKKTYWASNRTFNDQNVTAINGSFGEHGSGTYTLFLINSSNDTLKKQKFTFSGSSIYTIYAAGFQGKINDSIQGLRIKAYPNYPQR